MSPDSVAVIEPSDGRIVGSVPVGAEPGAMALAGGRLWVTNGGDRTLTAVDARSRRVVRTVGLTALPHTIAAGDGTLVAGQRLRRHAVAARARRRPAVPALPPAARIDRTARPGHRVRLGLGRLAGRRRREARPGDPGPALHDQGVDNPEALAAGAGAVWVLPSSRRAVLAIDPRLNRTVASIPLGDAGKAIAVTDDAVWVLGERRLWRIDPKRRLVTATVGLRSPATALAAGEGAVWVADGPGGTVTRVDPESAEAGARSASAAHRRPPRRRRRAVGGGALS